jgi:methionyl aminopeptidase
MSIESPDDITGLMKIGRIVGQTIAAMRDALEPGMTTAELDAFGEKVLGDLGARSAPQLAYKFPGATCISINSVAAHGIPDASVLRDGDLVNIDVSAELDGYFADTGGSFVVGTASAAQQKLLDATLEARDSAIAQLRAGNLLNSIGRTVETVAARRGLRVIRNLGSHGVGRALHEAPGNIPGYYDPRDTRRLHEGMVITIEPFLATHCTHTDEGDDGWAMRCRRGFAAQFEHTVVVTSGEPIVVT